MKKIFTPMVEEILISYEGKDKEILDSVGCEPFNGECDIEFEFHDGYAYDTDGLGLMLKYPKLDELTEDMIDAIQEYIGIYDDTISFHDVALKYGELNKKEDDLTDIFGIVLSIGLKVHWNDPQEEYRDVNRTWEIVAISGEGEDSIILIADEYSESEVYASELVVIL